MHEKKVIKRFDEGFKNLSKPPFKNYFYPKYVYDDCPEQFKKFVKDYCGGYDVYVIDEDDKLYKVNKEGELELYYARKINKEKRY